MCASLTDLSHVLNAARSLIELDERQANAVAARIELDLRIGAAFTRLLTLQLQNLHATLTQKVISYGMPRRPF
jgi:DNA topoisomerase-3